MFQSVATSGRVQKNMYFSVFALKAVNPMQFQYISSICLMESHHTSHILYSQETSNPFYYIHMRELVSKYYKKPQIKSLFIILLTFHALTCGIIS